MSKSARQVNRSYKRGQTSRAGQRQTKQQANVAAKPGPRKRKAKSSTASTAKRRHISVQETSDEEESEYHDYDVPAKVLRTWKPMTQTSTDFVTEIMDANIIKVLNGFHQKHYETLKDLLTKLKDRSLKKMKGLRTPVSRVVKHPRTMWSDLEALTDQVKANSELIQRLEEEIDNQDRLADSRQGEEDWLSRELENVDTSQPEEKQKEKELRQQLKKIRRMASEIKSVSSDSETQ